MLYSGQHISAPELLLQVAGHPAGAGSSRRRCSSAPAPAAPQKGHDLLIDDILGLGRGSGGLLLRRSEAIEHRLHGSQRGVRRHRMLLGRRDGRCLRTPAAPPGPAALGAA